jgi:hypothetical protein
VICALCLALLTLAVPTRAAAAPQPQPAPSGSSSTPSPDPSPGATTTRSANSSSSSVSASSNQTAVNNSAPLEQPAQSTPAQQPAQTATPVAQPSGGGVSLAGPTFTRPSSSSPRPSGSTANSVPVRSVPLARASRAASKHRHLARRAAVSRSTPAPHPTSLWRHLHAVWTLPATVRALLPLPHRGGLLLLFGAVALFVLAGASASFMRMLTRMGAG